MTLDALDRPNSQIHGGSDGKVSPLKSSAPVLKKKREVSTTKAQRLKGTKNTELLPSLEDFAHDFNENFPSVVFVAEHPEGRAPG